MPIKELIEDFLVGFLFFVLFCGLIYLLGVYWQITAGVALVIGIGMISLLLGHVIRDLRT